MPTYYGFIVDSQTASAIPRVTVTAYFRDGSIQHYIAQTAPGEPFRIDTPTEIAEFTFSSVGYKPFNTPANEFQHQWELERNYVQLPTVVLPGGSLPKANWTMPLFAILLMILLKNKK